MKSTHSGRLERWFSAETLEKVSQDMRGWYGPPIALHGVPGAVYATGDGDFVGECRAGWEASKLDRAREVLRRMHRGLKWAGRSGQLNTGFASLSDLISEATAGKRREFTFQKVGSTGVTAVSFSLWRLGNQPIGGAAPANAPGGTAQTSATTGAFAYDNPTAPDTFHFVSGYPLASIAGNNLLLFDLIFGVNKTMASVATEAVTGVPTRYQSSVATNAEYSAGNFLFVQVGGTALAATAHNWTVCLYTDQDGNTGATLPSLTGNSGAVIDRLDHPTQQWFAPLASGDTGIKALTQMQCSASVATGVIWFMMGHPIAWMPCPIANLVCIADGINTSFNLTRIIDNACLAMMEVTKPSSSACTYTGTFTAVAG